MNYRTTTLMARTNLGTTGTRIVDINIRDPISALIFTIEVTLLAAIRLTHALDCISKIELVDGSDVLMALSASQMDGLHFYERGDIANDVALEIPNATEVQHTAVLFGRYLHDPELVFDPRKFTNPQLRITFNAAAVSVGATPVFLTILAECFDEKAISPVGFLQNREFYSYTPTVGTYHYIDLPTDLPLRKLFVQPTRLASRPAMLLDDARLDEDNLKRIPFDITALEWRNLSLQQFGVVKQNIVATRGLPNGIIHAGSDMCSGSVTSVGANTAMQIIGTMGCWLLVTDGGADTTTFFGIVNSILPYWMMAYPFGDQKEIADWYDTSRVGSLRLRLHDGLVIGAGAVTNVILQQLRRY